jgi:hypothetical protein
MPVQKSAIEIVSAAVRPTTEACDDPPPVLRRREALLRSRNAPSPDTSPRLPRMFRAAGSGAVARSWPGQSAERPQKNDDEEGDRQDQNDQPCWQKASIYRQVLPSNCATAPCRREPSCISAGKPSMISLRFPSTALGSRKSFYHDAMGVFTVPKCGGLLRSFIGAMGRVPIRSYFRRHLGIKGFRGHANRAAVETFGGHHADNRAR